MEVCMLEWQNVLKLGHNLYTAWYIQTLSQSHPVPFLCTHTHLLQLYLSWLKNLCNSYLWWLLDLLLLAIEFLLMTQNDQISAHSWASRRDINAGIEFWQIWWVGMAKIWFIVKNWRSSREVWCDTFSWCMIQILYQSFQCFSPEWRPSYSSQFRQK